MRREIHGDVLLGGRTGRTWQTLPQPLERVVFYEKQWPRNAMYAAMPDHSAIILAYVDERGNKRLLQPYECSTPTRAGHPPHVSEPTVRRCFRIGGTS